MEAHGDGNDADGDALVRVNPDGSAVDYPCVTLTLTALSRRPGRDDQTAHTTVTLRR